MDKHENIDLLQTWSSMMQKRLWEFEKYLHMIIGWKRIHKPRRILSGFLRIFMELCESKAQLVPLHGNFISGVANPEIVYMLLRFQIVCIDWFFFFFFLKRLLWQKNLLNFKGITWARSNHLKVFWKVDVLSS